jgi:hypothetical protein
MFDLRYHVASLAAVFFALVIGILVGVALASHGLGNSERRSLQDDVRRAQNRADALKTRFDALTQTSTADHTFVENTYKALMADRLTGKRIAVLFVGSADHRVQNAVTGALEDASGAALRIYSVQVPIDDAAVSKRLSKRPFLASYAGDDQLKNLGKALGEEFVAGNESPLWKALQTLIVQEAHPRFGKSKRPADGVVVVRTADPQTGPTAPFLKGLYAGLTDIGVPAVGVAASADAFTARPVFQEAGLSTVDDVDTLAGKLALVVLLAGPAAQADYGTKVEKLLPAVPPVTTTTGG